MSWESLGILELTAYWQLLPREVQHVETFRVHQYFQQLPYGTILLAQSWSSDLELFDVQVIYPMREDLIVDLLVPAGFKARGMTRRYIAARLSRSSRFQEFWKLGVEALV